VVVFLDNLTVVQVTRNYPYLSCQKFHYLVPNFSPFTEADYAALPFASSYSSAGIESCLPVGRPKNPFKVLGKRSSSARKYPDEFWGHNSLPSNA
jgi:hypothetical protein